LFVLAKVWWNKNEKVDNLNTSIKQEFLGLKKDFFSQREGRIQHIDALEKVETGNSYLKLFVYLIKVK